MLCWLCLRYGCHISANSTFHPAVCGEKYFMSQSPTNSAHHLLLFHHRKAMLWWPQRTLVWVDRRHLSIYAGISYFSEIAIPLKGINWTGIWSGISKSTSSVAVLLCYLFLWRKNISSVLNNIIEIAVCFERGENPGMCVTQEHTWADQKSCTSGCRQMILRVVWIPKGLFCRSGVYWQ